MPITIRDIKVNDENAINEFFLLKNSKLKWDFQNFLNDEQCFALVIEDNKKIIGFGALITYYTPLHGMLGRLEDIFIHPEAQGNGYGSKIIKALIEIAEEIKLEEIHLTSSKKRQAARHIYEKLGFEIYDTDVFIKKN